LPPTSPKPGCSATTRSRCAHRSADRTGQPPAGSRVARGGGAAPMG
jgi:hypothetical protein